MATDESGTPMRPRRRFRRVVLMLVAALLGALAWFWQPLTGRAIAAAAFGAHVGCSCRFIQGRTLDSCRGDFEPGMALVSLSEDAEGKSVTARVPLLARQTAFYRQGEGCVLEPWTD